MRRFHLFPLLVLFVLVVGANTVDAQQYQTVIKNGNVAAKITSPGEQIPGTPYTRGDHITAKDADVVYESGYYPNFKVNEDEVVTFTGEKKWIEVDSGLDIFTYAVLGSVEGLLENEPGGKILFPDGDVYIMGNVKLGAEGSDKLVQWIAANSKTTIHLMGAELEADETAFVNFEKAMQVDWVHDNSTNIDANSCLFVGNGTGISSRELFTSSWIHNNVNIKNSYFVENDTDVSVALTHSRTSFFAQDSHFINEYPPSLSYGFEPDVAELFPAELLDCTYTPPWNFESYANSHNSGVITYRATRPGGLYTVEIWPNAEQIPIQTDINDNGSVGLEDLRLVAGVFGTLTSELGIMGPTYDIHRNGLVDLGDVLQIGYEYADFVSGIPSEFLATRTDFVDVMLEYPEIVEAALADDQTSWFIGQYLESTAVVELSNDVPEEFGLDQNYPNPFNAETTINYQIKESGEVRLAIYNVAGQLVQTLVAEYQQPGSYQIHWDGLESSGINTSSGIYFYLLEAEGFRKTKQMLLLK